MLVTYTMKYLTKQVLAATVDVFRFYGQEGRGHSDAPSEVLALSAKLPDEATEALEGALAMHAGLRLFLAPLCILCFKWCFLSGRAVLNLGIKIISLVR